jgi:hypothetical protein
VLRVLVVDPPWGSWYALMETSRSPTQEPFMTRNVHWVGLGIKLLIRVELPPAGVATCFVDTLSACVCLDVGLKMRVLPGEFGT